MSTLENSTHHQTSKTSNKIEIIQTKLAPNAVGTYSQGTIHGDTIYFSGQIGLEPKTMQIHDDFEKQIQQVLKNLDGLLQSQNLTRQHIIKTTIFMTDLSLFSEVNKAYENFFQAPYPARSTVEVSRLPKDALIEIEVIASLTSTR